MRWQIFVVDRWLAYDLAECDHRSCLGCMFLFLVPLMSAEKVTVIQEVRELLSNSFLLTVIPVIKELYIGTRKESKKEQKGK